MGPERTDTHNLIMAILFSIAIIFGFQLIFAPQEKLGQRDTGRQTGAGTDVGPGTQQQAGAGKSRSRAPVRDVADKPVLPREEALAACRSSDGRSLRIAIETEVVTGSICRIGAVFDDLTLERHW